MSVQHDVISRAEPAGLLLTFSEAARELGLSLSTVQRLVAWSRGRGWSTAGCRLRCMNHPDYLWPVLQAQREARTRQRQPVSLSSIMDDVGPLNGSLGAITLGG